MIDQAPDPAGTVYGQARRTPPVMPVVVGVAAVAVAGVGFVAWNSTGGADRAESAPPPPPPPPSATASSGSVPAQLAAGTWVVSPLGDPGTYLTTGGDFAELSTIDPLPLTVVPGLADDSCYTFHTEDGRYLRHYDFRLRFDVAEDSDLFRADATFCQEAGTAIGTVRLRSKNYPEYLVHRRGEQLYIDRPDGSAGFVTASSFMVQEP
ncbi:AbfB domain-containing protein [Actinoplanes flavus]|uniref:AbfB domain-containing protein n=1 Tax=Actinoplanes flavus TaxID=2820290 RepID=A0ABS3V017_9ACTN|nr:AbfB domain-containing protein [Actinoplanes flavus]MBO3744181.1 AbfB domain-containing protein [Actinoplanes flavus]